MECGDSADYTFLHKLGETDVEARNLSQLSETIQSVLKDFSGREKELE